MHPPKKKCLVSSHRQVVRSVWAYGLSSWKSDDSTVIWLNRENPINNQLHSSGIPTQVLWCRPQSTFLMENLKIPIFKIVLMTNNKVSIYKHTHRAATACWLASWQIGCHGCYENPGQRWLGRTISSNCGRELHWGARWGSSGGWELPHSVLHYSKNRTERWCLCENDDFTKSLFKQVQHDILWRH